MFKATAGLHHAVPPGGEHGFLNLLAAAVFGDEEDGAREDAQPCADEPTASPGATGSRRSEIARGAREAFVGFGSCSVAEPVDELPALGSCRERVRHLLAGEEPARSATAPEGILDLAALGGVLAAASLNAVARAGPRGVGGRVRAARPHVEAARPHPDR